MPAAAICKAHRTTFMILPVDPEPDRMPSANACVIPLSLLPPSIV